MPRRICTLLFTFTIVAATALPAGAQLLPHVTTKPAKPPATKPAQIVVESSPNAEVYLDDQYTGRASAERRTAGPALPSGYKWTPMSAGPLAVKEPLTTPYAW